MRPGAARLLIFDEAQNLSLESLEELRMLTNINTGKDVVVQLVLTGQPELRDLVRSPRLEQLAQRIAVSYDLKPWMPPPRPISSATVFAPWAARGANSTMRRWR